MRLDVTTSTVVLRKEDGTECRLPAVGILCPCNPQTERCSEWWPDEAEHRWNHLLGYLGGCGSRGGECPEVYVPAENRTLFELGHCRRGTHNHRNPLDDLTVRCDLLELTWYHGHLTVQDTYPEDAGFIPPAIRTWQDCEEGWVVETIRRLGSRAAPALDARDLPLRKGPRVTLLSLAEVDEIWKEKERVK